MEKQKTKTLCKKSISFLLALLLVLLAIPLSASADYIYTYVYEDWELEPLGNDKVCIRSYYGSETDLVIPQEIDKQKVVQIANLYSKTKLTRVTVPESVRSIWGNPWHFPDLKEIRLPNTPIAISDGVFEETAYYNTDSNWENGVLYIGKHLIKARDSVAGAYQIKQSTLTIAENAFRDCVSLTAITVPSSVLLLGGFAFSDCDALCKAELQSKVDIPWGCFYNCTALTSIKIPNGVTNIGEQAFYNCTSLNSIALPDSVTDIGSNAFNGCSSLEEIAFSANLTNVGTWAFYNCTALKRIVLPNGVTFIGLRAFYNCSSLENIVIPDSVTYIGEEAFYNTAFYNDEANWENDVLYIGKYLIKAKLWWSDSPKQYSVKSGTKVIADEAFEGNGMESVSLPNSVFKIGHSAFKDCRCLTAIEIPDSVTDIGSSVFENCTALKSIVLPNSFAEIPYGMFRGCAALESVKIPDSATIIANDAFANCTALKNIVIPDSVTTIGETYSSGGAFRGCTSLTAIQLSNNATMIGDRAFFGCTALKHITIPDSVTDIGQSTFENCAALESVTIGNQVSRIDFNTFKDCASLTDIRIPNKVTYIGGSAFSNCISLKNIEIPDSVTYIGEKAFYNTVYYNTESNWENSVLYIGHHLIKAKETVSGTYIVNSNTKTISPGAFENCISLASITIPYGVNNINYNTFYGCSALENVSIPDSVTSIDSYAFYDCPSLTCVTIPGSVTDIGECAFGFYDDKEADAYYQEVDGFTIYGLKGSRAESYAKGTFNFVALDVLTDSKNDITVIFPKEHLPNIGTVLSVQETAKTDDSITFDISLTNNDTPVQPAAPVTVKIPVPATMDGSKCKVYRQEADGTYTDMQAIYQDGYMVFTTDHFSIYVLTVKDPNAPAITMGDINGDGVINAVDARWALQSASGVRTLSDEQFAAADVNGDGKITAVDARWILQAASGVRVL